MDEKMYFNEHGISVSKSQVIIYGQSLPLETVASLSFKMVEPKRWIAALMIFIGLPLILNGILFDGGMLEIIGGYSTFLGMIAWASARTLYSVTLNTVFGDSKVIESDDSLSIEHIIYALDQAMAAAARSL